jgi:hypothetical protein
MSLTPSKPNKGKWDPLNLFSTLLETLGDHHPEREMCPSAISKYFGD